MTHKELAPVATDSISWAVRKTVEALGVERLKKTSFFGSNDPKFRRAGKRTELKKAA